jgi:hypothetical protein
MRNSIDLQSAKVPPTGVTISPPDMVRGRKAAWAGIRGTRLKSHAWSDSSIR